MREGKKENERHDWESVKGQVRRNKEKEKKRIR